MKKKVLITGINGFVGRHLSCSLLDAGYDVCGIDLNDVLSWQDNIFYKKCDITDFKSVKDIFCDYKPDIIYHLAAISNVDVCNQNIGQALDINVKGFANILSSIKDINEKIKIFFISSAQVYGRTGDKLCPFKENLPFNPANAYASTKICCEIIAKQFYNNYGLDIVCLRPFNHYGPYQALGFIIPDLCSQISEIEKGLKDAVINVGNTNVFRDFLFIKDIVSAYISAIDKCVGGEVYNICSGMPVLIKDLINILIGFSKVNIEVISGSINIRKNEINKLYGNNLKFIKETEWEIEYNLEKGLLETLNYWRK